MNKENLTLATRISFKELQIINKYCKKLKMKKGIFVKYCVNQIIKAINRREIKKNAGINITADKRIL